MSYVQGIHRHQSTLFPEMLDDFIDQDNAVRFLDEFVASLPMRELGFTHSVLAATGRPPYNPEDLLKLYLYGYLNWTRSSRRLERLTKCNVEVMWLLNRVEPDFKTISDFRKDNIVPLKKVTKTFTLLCKAMNLFGGELIGIDGSKFSAVNHSSRYYSKEKLQKMLEKVEENIKKYYEALEEEDRTDAPLGDISDLSLQEKIAEMHRRKEEIERMQRELEESGQTQLAMTDSDSRMMHATTGRNDMSYNVQIAVDDKHHLIVAHDVTSAVNDTTELSNIALAAKEILGVEQLDEVSDTGYFSGEEIRKCVEAGISCYIPKPKSSNEKKGLFTNEDFRYDAEKDCYHCPAHEVLNYRGTKKGKRVERIYSSGACPTCRHLEKCTRDKRKRRKIYRWEHEHLIEEMQERLKKDPEKMKKRKCLVEHPFGTMKFSMDQRYFLLKGKRKVNCEMGLTVMAYNMKRVLNILGIDTLREMMRNIMAKPSFLVIFSTGSFLVIIITEYRTQDRSDRIIRFDRWKWKESGKMAYALAA
jgi:transposase